jgi:EAL domain-containing protein (putative c-di-GMP-specific phosphodiesterase class I)
LREADSRHAIETLLRGGDGLRIVVQPIVDLVARIPIGFEALARFDGSPPRAPDWWFAQADVVGLRLELELLAIDRALALLPRIANGVYLSINGSPSTILHEEFAARLDSLDRLDRIVLEVTEQAPIEDYAQFEHALRRHRSRGLELAIDDTGAGFASLRHILQLRPDTIKLDRTLIDRIDRDRRTRALAAALTTFALETGTSVTAEGIETESQLSVIRALGVNAGQGYLLGRPGPL